jgi:hypothetical protein
VRNGRFEFCLRTLLVLFMPEGSFACRKSTTWDRRLYFPSEGSGAALAALPPGKRPSTHCIGGWVGPRAGLDGCVKSRPHRDSIAGPSSP